MQPHLRAEDYDAAVKHGVRRIAQVLRGEDDLAEGNVLYPLCASGPLATHTLAPGGEGTAAFYLFILWSLGKSGEGGGVVFVRPSANRPRFFLLMIVRLYDWF